MLILSSWQGEPLNNCEWSEVQMNGEGSDPSVPSPALAGYLGNAKNRGAVSVSCPWCSAKGQINILRSYEINFKESITLCTGPLCLFPLVSKPLDNICPSFPSQDIQGCKRKFYLALETKNPDQSHKRWKKFDQDIVPDGKCWKVDVDGCRLSDKSSKKRLLIEEHQKQQKVENAVKTTDASCIISGDSELSDDLKVRDPPSREVPPMGLTVQDLTQLIREASSENVCLTEKFHCKKFTVKNLCVTYKKLYAYIKAKEQLCQDTIVRVPSDDLRYVAQEMEALRMSAFQFLQPKLQCELGLKETPVFALPLLLRSDDWANSLFQHTGQWEFRCTCCGYNSCTSMEKTVTTFTQTMADWHPLRAVHRAQCSNCHKKNQKRKLVLQRISYVLALHFVEGLPRRDLSKYEFDFNGTHYSIRTIIQYHEQREHVVTWIQQQDGLWLEFDGLKHPYCITHKRFTLPARQFHLVFWEADYREIPQLSDPLHKNTLTQNTNTSKVEDVFQDVTNSLPDVSCVIESLTENTDSNGAASTWDSSIGSTTLFDTSEDLSHSDIVTLTMVEVQEDAKESCPNAQEVVKGPAESSIKEVFPLLEKSSFYQTPSSGKSKVGANKDVHSPELSHPSIEAALESVDPQKANTCSPALLSSKPKPSYSFHRHLSQQSTPLSVPFHATHPKVDLRSDGNETLLTKPAELFGGYKTKSSPNTVLTEGLVGHPFAKLPVSQKPFISPNVITVGPNSMQMKLASQNMLSTEALRLKLMKRLKAKKKKLAKLNQLLSIEEGESTPRPDSTNISSPYSVTSSTSAYDCPSLENFFTELLSPDMSSSNLSPDSTGLLETLTNSQSPGALESSPQKNFAPPSELTNDQSPIIETSLEKLNPGPSEQQSVIDNAEFYALDIFF